MSILPGIEFFNRLSERSNDYADMISDLIEQAHTNYLHYLAAAATTDVEQVWQRFHESFALEQDIDTLATLYELVRRNAICNLLL
ncbi:MAG: hypothetical protein CUN49_00640 [Candidatus Thermofonsia Clade 1 bacterium]|jgi:hypothetical protein|uniref:Uncharacterized protein n=1 Tax=Candidatus Thermofonsia Clade 1 bacterium TaxID=2364210 RepID=A0A2M8PIM4_9CHLR|nr:MAG: hypothetical protein CUN49_00640 [Candidatus Thermofonsia Clade 1 bacterium]RMF49265.1 MAG: hypothetical protein D6749_13660 [Chloroflexota bacterium]